MDLKFLNAVLRLEWVKVGKLHNIGIAVVFAEKGRCLASLHCIPHIAQKNLRVGGHHVEVLAKDKMRNIVVSQISDNDDDHTFEFILLGYKIPLDPTMDIHLASYTYFLDADESPVLPSSKTLQASITHGQITTDLPEPHLYAGDYECFPNSSGGAVVHRRFLIGVHVSNMFAEEAHVDKKGKKKPTANDRLTWLERNHAHKSSLGVFVSASAISHFLAEKELMDSSGLVASSSVTRGNAGLLINNDR